MLLAINACSIGEVESEIPTEDILGCWSMARVESENNFLPEYNSLHQPTYYVFTDSNLRMITYPCYHVRDVGYQLENDSLFMLIGQKKARFKFYLTNDTLKLIQDGQHGVSTLVFAKDNSFKEYNSFREDKTYYAGSCFDGYLFRHTGESFQIGDSIIHPTINPPKFIDLRAENNSDFEWTDNGILIYRIDSLEWHIAIEDYDGELIQFRPFNLREDTTKTDKSFLLSNEAFVYEKRK